MTFICHRAAHGSVSPVNVSREYLQSGQGTSPCPSYELTVDKLACYYYNFYRDSGIFHTPACETDCACIKGFLGACLFVSLRSHSYDISNIWSTGIWSTSAATRSFITRDLTYNARRDFLSQFRYCHYDLVDIKQLS